MRTLLMALGGIVLALCFCLIALRGKFDLRLNPFNRYWEVVLYALPNNLNTINELHNQARDSFEKMDIPTTFSRNNISFFKTMICRDNKENEELFYLVNNFAADKSIDRFYWEEYLFYDILEYIPNIETEKVLSLVKEIKGHTALKERVYMQIRYKSDKNI